MNYDVRCFFCDKEVRLYNSYSKSFIVTVYVEIVDAKIICDDCFRRIDVKRLKKTR